MLYRHLILERWFWRFWFSSAVVAWMVLIFYLSSLSQDEIGPGGSFRIEPAAWLGRGMPSQLVHLILYGVLAWLMQATLHSFSNSARRILPWAFVSATFAILYGISDEFHQTFIDGRFASVSDVLWDASGALAAAGILAYIISILPWLRGQRSKWPLFGRASSVREP